jgi:hypothetical protein
LIMCQVYLIVCVLIR